MGVGTGPGRKAGRYHRLIGFCLLIRREVIDAIGLLDERFGIGCFEDDDYCLRAIKAGWRAVIAQDAFVHHFGGRTFVGNAIDHAGILRENEQRFREKWGQRVPASPSPLPVLPAPSEQRIAFTLEEAPRWRIVVAQRPGAAVALHDRSQFRRHLATVPGEHPSLGR